MLRPLTLAALLLLTVAAGLPIAMAIAALPANNSAGLSTSGWLSPWVPTRLSLTLAIALGIATLATALAYPVARMTPFLSCKWLALPMLPILMPAYLIPGAWRTLLDPSSSIGSWLLTRSLESDINLLRLADQSLAIIGLSIWASPIAWLILHLHWRALGQRVPEALTLDASGWRRSQLALVGVARTAIVRAIVVVALVMSAQTIPFDLAQIETISNAVRVSVSLGRVGEAWLIAGPTLGIALIAGIWIASGRAWRNGDADGVTSQRITPARASVVLIPVVLGALLPVAMLAGSLRDASAIERFIRRSSSALTSTFLDALAVGALGALLSTALVVALRDSRRLALLAAAFFVVLSLIPGVLIGSAVAQASNIALVPMALADSPIPLWIAHLARFGVVGCLLAMWMRAIEPRSLDDLALLRGGSVRGWLLCDARRQMPAILGGALAIAALSVHEIEAAVILQPVGSDALARFMLELLHYQRRDDLAAGVLLIGMGSLALACGAAVLARGALGANPRRF